MLEMTDASRARRVAVIGAGPSGLTMAKHLLEAGLQPVVFEQSDDIGGQWHTNSPHSAIWPGMRTNTSRTTTAFSDFPPGPSGAMFQGADEVHAYLHEYAAQFGVCDHVRIGACVVEVAPAGDGWTVRWTENEREHTERFAGVAVASGRFRTPQLPDISGLAAPAPEGCVRHSSTYRGRDEFRGRRVVVYGNSISGLEIASDLAADHTISVISACRRPRYIVQKVVRGLPIDWRWLNRFSALLGAAVPREQAAEGLRSGVLAEAGDPARYGGLSVDATAAPKLSQSQEYLAYVAEGRIAAKPAIESIDGCTALFADGTTADFDVIICATGYDLDVSFLSEPIRRTLRADAADLDLHARTFHPDLPGLAFLGQFQLVGPYLPTVELQARWIAAVWSGTVPAPSRSRMRAGIAEHHAMRTVMPSDMYPALASMLAGELGVEPRLAGRPHLAEGLIFGPLAPARYRLDGPGARPEAEVMLRAALSEFGPQPHAAPQQLDALQMIATALEDPELADIAQRLSAAAAPEPAAH